MIAATRKWFTRNRTRLAVGAGAVGVVYLAGQYVVGKITEARQRMAEDRISKENLRRRFEQNQQDCTFTVLAILPTAAENVIEALPVENILNELQQQRSNRLARSAVESELSPSDLPSASQSTTEDESKSLKSFQSESFVHASQIAESKDGSDEQDKKSSTCDKAQLPSVKKSKAELWNELKISSITRSFTLIYTLSLLTLLTRIQLNLLGRRNYLASVVSLAAPPCQDSGISLENHDDDNLEHAYGNDFETNRRYLSFSWWLLHRGCKDILEQVRSAVHEVFGSVNPREEVTPERLSDLIMEVRKKIEGNDLEERRAQKWLSYLLPPRDLEDYVLRESGMEPKTDSLDDVSPSTASPALIHPPLRRLLDETADLADSPPFSFVMTLALDAAFTVLVDSKLAMQAFKIPPVSASSARVQEIVGGSEDVKAKLASCLPVFTKQAHVIGSLGMTTAGAAQSNEYLEAIDQVKDLEGLAALVYSSNFEFEEADLPSAEPDTLFAHSGLAEKDALGGEASLLDAGSGFEAAWGRALKE